jgi:eukaryotic-like serine/threonine-protein kinase
VLCLGATHDLLRFGPFELNLATEELRKHGLPLKLSPQPFRILALLAGRSGQIVTREEIRQQLWGEETYVDFEHGMNQCIKQIRTALCDNPDKPTYIETLPRKGYRFLETVTSKTVLAPLAVVESQSGVHSERLPAIAKPVSPQSLPPRLTGNATSAAAAPGPARELPPPVAPAARAGRLRIVVSGLVIAAVIAGFFYWHSRNASALTEKETLVLADFQNTTGDPVFDDALRQALAINLEEPQFLTVLSDRKVDEALKLMRRPAKTRITKDVADEICQRNGYKLVLAGSIASIGDHYLITLKATDCQTGEAIASAEAEAQSRNQVVKVLGQLGNQLRNKLGESRRSMERFSTPLEKATTSSLEALQAYTQGQKLLSQPNSAIPFLQTAVELDPNFARAYASLGAAYKNLGDTASSNENLNKAYELRDRVSLREHLEIEGAHYAYVTGQIEEAIHTYSQLAQTYPEDPEPHATLGAPLYSEVGRYKEAAAEMQERVRLSGQPDYNLAGVYACLNRFEEAQALLAQAPVEVDNEFLREIRYTLAFLRGDSAAMQEKLAAAMGKPAAEDRMLSAQSDTEAYYGRLAKARRLSEAAVRSAMRTEVPEVAAAWRANEALREAEMGESSPARQRAAEASRLSSESDVEVKTALAFARAGDATQAQALADKLAREYPLDTMMQSYWLPSIKAAIELNKDNPSEAIEILKPAMQYELGYTFAAAPGIASFGTIYPAYLRGRAYLQAGQGQQAAAEFQKLIDHRGILGNFMLGSLAYLQLARAQAMAGDEEAARKSYQDFFALWKDADPDIPIYRQAKAEAAKLQ